MSDASSGRNEANAGSDSKKHHKGTASEQFDTKTIAGATPTTAPNGQTVRDNKALGSVPGSAVRS